MTDYKKILKKHLVKSGTETIKRLRNYFCQKDIAI